MMYHNKACIRYYSVALARCYLCLQMSVVSDAQAPYVAMQSSRRQKRRAYIECVTDKRVPWNTSSFHILDHVAIPFHGIRFCVSFKADFPDLPSLNAYARTMRARKGYSILVKTN